MTFQFIGNSQDKREAIDSSIDRTSLTDLWNLFALTKPSFNGLFAKEKHDFNFRNVQNHSGLRIVALSLSMFYERYFGCFETTIV